MLKILIDVLKDTTIDSIKIIPFLFLSYLLIEYIEHKSSGKLEKILSNSGKYNKLIGASVGIIPQCGFSAVAATLFSNRVISVGTLIAVFLATSDEAIPMLISTPGHTKELFLILVIKFIIAVIFGTITDLLFKDKSSTKQHSEEIHEHLHDTCKNCNCQENGIFVSSLKHTFQIFTFLFVISFVLGTIIELIGINTFDKIILSGSIFQSFITSIIGLIPNCASSVLLCQLFINGSISIGATIAGLSTGAGVGAIVLLKTNKNMKENFKILGLLYIIGVFCGILIDLIMRLI